MHSIRAIRILLILALGGLPFAASAETAGRTNDGGSYARDRGDVTGSLPPAAGGRTIRVGYSGRLPAVRNASADAGQAAASRRCASLICVSYILLGVGY